MWTLKRKVISVVFERRTQNVEPDPLQKKDFVIDNVQAEDAHGMIHIEIACQGPWRKLTSAE